MKCCMFTMSFCVTAVLLLAGCGRGPKSGRGFTLPDGNAEQGRVAFLSHHCHECHTVSGVVFPKVEHPADTMVRIGGEVSHIDTYGELVTSIINPSKKLATGYPRDDVANGEESKMTNYNDVLTVQELIDLVAFLQRHYKLQPFDPTEYPTIPY